MHETNWASEQQKAIYIEFGGKWQQQEFTDAERTVHQMLSKVGHSVGVVVNITEPRPLTMDLVRQMRELLSLGHPNRGQVILVTPAGYQEGFQEVIRRAFGGSVPDHIRFADSIQQAETLLN